MFTGSSWPRVLRPLKPRVSCGDICMISCLNLCKIVLLVTLVASSFFYIIFVLTLTTYESWFRGVTVIQKTGYWVLGDGGLSWYSLCFHEHDCQFLLLWLLLVWLYYSMSSSAIFAVIIRNSRIVIHKFCTFVTGNDTGFRFMICAAMDYTCFDASLR